jgi:hypothetical protein
VSSSFSISPDSDTFIAPESGSSCSWLWSESMRR